MSFLLTVAGNDIFAYAILRSEEKRSCFMRRARRIILFIIIFLIFISAVTGHIMTAVKNMQKLYAPNGLLTIPNDSEREYVKSLKKKRSDISGMTQYDKYMQGLAPNDGSDTDGDGLSDKDEIEKYHTDPHKASTSGDLITDGEKIEHGLETDRKYTVKPSSIKYPYNECNEVSLSADSAEARRAVVQKPYFNKLKGVKTYQEYQITCFSGKMTIDLTDILKDNKTDISSISVFLQEDTGDAKNITDRVKFHGRNVTVSGLFDADKHYDLFIAKKPFLANTAEVIDADSDDNSLLGMFNDVKGKDSYNSVISGKGDMDGIIFGAPFLHFLSGEINVFYYDTGDKKKNDIEIQTLIKRANSIDEADMTAKSSKIRKASKAQINGLYRLFSTVFPHCNGSGYGKGNESDWDLLFYYERFASADTKLAENNAEIWKDIHAKRSHSGFTFGKDQFAFPNMSSKLTGGGLCSGIATYTSHVFNTGKVEAPLTDAVIDKNGTRYMWDISGKQFDQLRTKGEIHSFRNKDFVKEHKDKNGYMAKDMSDDDNSLLNMIVWYWSKANKVNARIPRYKTHIPAFTAHSMNTYDFSWDIIEYLKKKIDKGQIVSLGTQMGNDKSDLKEYSGHEINLVDYVQRSDDSVKFKVYDSNYPDNDNLWLYVTKRFGSFDYIYQPDKNNNDYVMTNHKMTGTYEFSVIDESDFTQKAIATVNHAGRMKQSGIDWDSLKVNGYTK